MLVTKEWFFGFQLTDGGPTTKFVLDCPMPLSFSFLNPHGRIPKHVQPGIKAGLSIWGVGLESSDQTSSRKEDQQGTRIAAWNWTHLE